MNILLINHYAGSPDMGMEFRPYYMAREWVKAGHNVTIIAGDYSHLRIKNPEVQHDYQEEMIDDIRYVWVKTGMYEGNGLARALTMFRFVRKLKARASTIACDWKPDVVIASSTYPLDTYAAQKIAKLAGAKLIHEVHDMWPATLYEIGGMPKSHPFVVLMGIAEKSAYTHSDKVVSLLGNAKDYMVEHGMASDKFVHIPNGVVLDEWDNPESIPSEHQERLGALRDEGKFIVGFFGGHALSNGLSILLDAAQQMRYEKDTAFVLVGDGVEKPALMERAKRDGLDNVCFLPPVRKHCVPSLLSFFDCSYIGGANSPLYRFGVSPNKLFDSMMASLPVINVVQAPNSPVEEFACGVVSKSQLPEDVVIAIRAIESLPENERVSMGEKGRKAVLENYTYEVLANKFIESMG